MPCGRGKTYPAAATFEFVSRNFGGGIALLIEFIFQSFEGTFVNHFVASKIHSGFISLTQNYGELIDFGPAL